MVAPNLRVSFALKFELNQGVVSAGRSSRQLDYLQDD